MSKPNAVFCFGGNTASLNDGTSLATLYVEDITSVNPSLADNQPDFIISAVIADPCVDTNSQATKPGAVKKTGSGMLKLTANNTYTGATTVSAGTLLLASSGNLASDVTVEAGAVFIDGANSITSDVTLSGGAFTIGETSATSRITIGDFALTSGTVNFDFNNASTANDFDTLTTGAATLTSGVINVTFNNGDETSWWNNAADSGYVLLTSSALSADWDNLAVYINSSETTNWYLTTEGNSLVLNKTGSVITQPYYYADSAEDISAAKWTIDGSDKLGAKLVSGDNASVTYSNPVEMNAKGSVQVAADYNLTLSGNITGSGDLEKTDSGTLTISSTNDGFAGATKVSGGTLALTAQNAISNSASVENNSLITMSADQKLNNLTVYGNVIIDGGATGLFEFSRYNEYRFDTLTIDGDDKSFSIDTTSIIKLYFEGGDDVDLWAAVGETYKLISADNYNGATPTLDAGDFTDWFRLDGVANDGLYLIGLGAGPIPPGPEPGSGVPEPSTWALLILGAALLFWRKRKNA